MSQNTRFNGTWTITGVETTSNVQVNSHTLIVNGNLKVLGSVANISATNTQITDNIITLNQGETGAGVTSVYAGIEVDRGLSPKVAIRWNEGTLIWELSKNGATYEPIYSGAPGIAALTFDPSPQLGGNLDVAARSIYSASTEIIKHDTNVAIQNTTVAPSVHSGYNVLYSQTAGTGRAGLFVTNDTVQQQELITKNKALFYALMM
jgi:hypothetical protein